MAKIPNKTSPQENIPTKESTHKGIPVTDVASAQEVIMSQLQAPASEQPVEDENQESVEENTLEQATEDAESVEAQTENPDGLTVDDLVEDNQAEETQEPVAYTVKIDGKDVEVSLDELRAGYSRQADYTRKSQVLAEQRRKADEELAATQQERQRYVSQLEQVSVDADNKLNKFKDVDWAKLKEDDPMEYALKRDQYRELQESKRLIADEQQKEQYKQQQEQERAWNEELARQQEIVAQRLPDLVDPEKGPKLKQSIKSFAINKGFSEQEVDSLIDARSVDVLHKAMLYENLLNSKISKKKAKVVPKVTKPGAGVTKGEVSSEKIKQQRARLKRTGKVDDAAKLLEGLI
tara:strand:- start:1082 stop:2131 length:1050 start_codon:yes stop_codon:yes gene_type:complete